MQKQKEYHQKQKEKKRNKRLMKQAKKVASALPTKEAASKTSDTPVKDPEPQKKETSKSEKKETHRIKAQNKVQDESEEEIPLLVPIGKSPTKENVEVCLLIFNIHHGVIQVPLCVRQAWLSDGCKKC